VVGPERRVQLSPVQRVLDALASPVRREILWRIWDEELTAGAIAAAFHLTAPTISEHLAVLRAAGLVAVRPVANRRYYRAVQDAVRGLQSQLRDEASRWVPRSDAPTPRTAAARTVPAVVARVELARPRHAVFEAFTSAELYSRWLGVPVSLQDGRFACTLEWGTQVRGTYEHVVAASLIALLWDFDDERVPLPGGALVTYIRFGDVPGGCAVTVHQIVDTPEQAQFMDVAWTFVLGRLEQGLDAALDGATGRADRPGPRS
jgi:DNA-binding transcriptional ArsR family regulator